MTMTWEQHDSIARATGVKVWWQPNGYRVEAWGFATRPVTPTLRQAWYTAWRMGRTKRPMVLQPHSCGGQCQPQQG